MTLNTHMYIQGEVDGPTLIQTVKDALAALDTGRLPAAAQRWRQKGTTFTSVQGQGLPAWTSVRFGEAGAWLSPEDEYAAPEDVAAGEEPWFIAPRCFAAINFDTTYGARGPNGETCNQIHAHLIVAIGAWLDEQGVPWQWENEYTGHFHVGRFGLDAFAGPGFEHATETNTEQSPSAGNPQDWEQTLARARRIAAQSHADIMRRAAAAIDEHPATEEEGPGMRRAATVVRDLADQLLIDVGDDPAAAPTEP